MIFKDMNADKILFDDKTLDDGENVIYKFLTKYEVLRHLVILEGHWPRNDKINLFLQAESELISKKIPKNKAIDLDELIKYIFHAGMEIGSRITKEHIREELSIVSGDYEDMKKYQIDDAIDEGIDHD